MKYVGVNGCKGGWIGVVLDQQGGRTHLVATRFAAIAAAYPSALILVDVPIGLRDSGPEERRCDKEARAALGPRASSVFPAPCRSAIWQANYEAGSEENYRQTGRRLSAQSWAIVSKIREVEDYLRSHSADGPIVREIHPEVCFWGLARRRPMQWSKHKKEGTAERVAILASFCAGVPEFVQAVRDSAGRSAVAEDDILDALVGAVVASIGAQGLRTLPDSPEVDSHGLRMEMVYAFPRA